MVSVTCLEVSRRHTTTVLCHLDIVVAVCGSIQVTARPVTGAPRIREGRRHVAGLLVPCVRALCANGRIEVDDEGDGVECEDEGYGPFEDRGGVVLLNAAAYAKGDDEGDLYEDEGELHPERPAKDTMLAVVDSKALVLPADTNSREQIASNKERQKRVVQSAILASLEDRKTDKSHGSDGRKGDREAAEDLLHEGRVGYKTASMSQPSLRQERSIEKDGGQDAADDEERLKTACADIGDVGDVGVNRLSGISTTVLINLPFEKKTEKHSEPDKAGNDWKPPV